MDDENKLPITQISYISTGLSDSDRDYPNLQEMQQMVELQPELTAAELLAEVTRQIQASKQERIARNAKYRPQDPETAYQKWKRSSKN